MLNKCNTEEVVYCLYVYKPELFKLLQIDDIVKLLTLAVISGYSLQIVQLFQHIDLKDQVKDIIFSALTSPTPTAPRVCDEVLLHLINTYPHSVSAALWTGATTTPLHLLLRIGSKEITKITELMLKYYPESVKTKDSEGKLTRRSLLKMCLIPLFCFY